MAQLPTGTVTFLFTDIEGSTPLWEQQPAAMNAALAHHNALLGQAIESHRGYVFKTVGDAFCVAFATAMDALHAALAIQRELGRFNGEPILLHPDSPGRDVEGRPSPIALRVRMGLHTGETAERDGDYFGATVNRVARIMSVAHGGQMLLSLVTAELVRGQLPDGVTLRDMGEHRLKGFVAPERILQIVASDLPSDFSPLVSLTTIPNNLPTQLTSFIGREKDIAQVKDLLTGKGVPTGRLSPRLLTLTGAGGTGKTRLSLQVGAEVLEAFKEGVWFIELAPLSDPALVPQTVASVLGVRERHGRPLLDTICDYLRAKGVLLVLDNCEHLVEACAQFADAVLRGTSHVKILASSREALGIAGELAWHVPSLQVPNPKHRIQLEQLEQYESVRLFIERAILAQPSFRMTDANAPAVVQICYRLDGLPLATELAAARVKALSVEQIDARLDDQFRLLTGGSRAALPRQQTLRALIDWSHNLLDEEERILLRRLSIFAGGWTLEAAEAVCAGEGVDRSELLDLLTQLVNKSLVIFEEPDGHARYRMLETIRQYAREKLLEVEQSDAIRDRHLSFFVRLAEEAAPKLEGKEVKAWLDRLEREMDNVRIALDRSKDIARLPGGLRLATALEWFWYPRGYQAEGLEHLQVLVGLLPPATHVLARARALIVVATIQWARGSYAEASRTAKEALAIGNQLADRSIIADAYLRLGAAATAQGDYARALAFYEQSLLNYQTPDTKHETASVLFFRLFRGEALLRQGDYVAAQTFFLENIARMQELELKNYLAYVTRRLGQTLLHQADYSGARIRFQESLVVNVEIGDVKAVAACLAAFAALALAQKELARAAQLFGASEAVSESIYTEMTPYDHDQYTRNVAALHTQSPAADFDAAWEAGRKLTLEEAVKLAME